jgi:bacteriocin biosynthesis cyclodehydratase domain-containing protein
MNAPDLQSLSVPAYPALVHAARWYSDGAGNILLGCARNWLRLRPVGGNIDRLLALLDGSRSVDDILTEAPTVVPGIQCQHVLQLLESLSGKGLLMAGKPDVPQQLISEPDYLDRHSRDLEFFSLFETVDATRYDFLDALQRSHVVIIGLGGVGSWVALSLACAGVGTITGVDFDCVELSNLSRQVLYTESDVGFPKVEATGRFFQRFSPNLHYVPVELQIAGPDDVKPVVAGSDLVILAADWPPRTIARWTNEACATAGVPSLYMFGGISQIGVGPLVVPGRTSCYRCVCTMRGAESDWIEQAALRAGPNTRTPVLSPLPSMLGHMLAWEAVCWLTGIQQPRSLEHILYLDLTTMSVDSFPILQDPECPVCRPFLGTRDALAKPTGVVSPSLP